MSRIQARGHWLPWAHFNLRRNPFGELTATERVETAVFEVGPCLDLLQQNWTAIQFIGECGRGKTTRLLALKSKLPRSSYVYLGEDLPCPAIPEGSPVMIDEAQRLTRTVQNHVFSSGLPLVLGTHSDLSRILRRYGHTVHTLHVGDGNGPELVEKILNRRIEASRLCDGPIPTVSAEDATRLVNRFGTNIRRMEHYLYERIQFQVTHDGEMRFID